MNIEHLITYRFKHLMSCTWSDFPKSKNRFENYIYKLRQHVEAGEPFSASSSPYQSSSVAEYGYMIREYCENDMPEGTVEKLVMEELDRRGLVYNTIAENAEAVVIPSGTYEIHGWAAPVVLEQELLPCDEFLGHPIYRHEGKIFTIESVKVKEDAPVNNVGGGNIAGVSPGQEPPGRRGQFFRRNLKKTEKLKRDLKKRF